MCSFFKFSFRNLSLLHYSAAVERIFYLLNIEEKNLSRLHTRNTLKNPLNVDFSPGVGYFFIFANYKYVNANIMKS